MVVKCTCGILLGDQYSATVALLNPEQWPPVLRYYDSNNSLVVKLEGRETRYGPEWFATVYRRWPWPSGRGNFFHKRVYYMDDHEVYGREMRSNLWAKVAFARSMLLRNLREPGMLAFSLPGGERYTFTEYSQHLDYETPLTRFEAVNWARREPDFGAPVNLQI